MFKNIFGFAEFEQYIKCKKRVITVEIALNKKGQDCLNGSPAFFFVYNVDINKNTFTQRNFYKC